MGGIFSDRNPLVRGLTTICDMAILSFIWLVSSVPIITIGASTTALYYTTVKVLRRGKGYIFEQYKHSFKENFKQGTIMWLCCLLVFLICGMNAYVSFTWISASINETMGRALAGVYLGIMLVMFGVAIYMFPVLSRFVVGKWQLFKMAMLLSFKHVISTVALMVITAVAILGEIYFLLMFPMLAFFTPAAMTMLFSLVMEPVLRKYMPEDAWGDDERTKEEIMLEEEMEEEE